MTRILALGDTQLGVGGRLDDQAAVLARVADLAVERQVGFVLHAGDVFEGPGITPEQLGAFADFVAEIRAHDIPLVTVCGNSRHDAAMRGPTGLGIFNHVPGVEVHTRPGVSVLGDVAVACLPWVHPGRLIASRDGGDRDEAHVDVAELLLRIAEGLREDCEAMAPGAPAILLLHWAISGATLPTGLPVDALREPVIPLAGLLELGFRTIVAGHIHRSQVLSEDPWIGYVGSPQPHNHGEAGYEHGVWTFTFDDALFDRLEPQAEFVPIQSRPFLTLEWLDLAADPAAPVEEIPARVAAIIEKIDAETDAPILRVRYRATRAQARRIDTAAIIRAGVDAGAHEVKVEPEIVREQTARVEGLDEMLSELDALALYIAAHPDLAHHAAQMRARAAKYLEVVA